MEKLIAMSASGRFVVLRLPGAVEIVDVQGTAPRRCHPLADGGEFAIAGGWLCLHDSDRLRALRLDGSATGELVIAGGALRPFAGRSADALLVGDALVALEPAPAIVGRITGFPLAGRAVLTADGAIVTSGRPTRIDAKLGEIRGAAPLFGGSMIGVVAGDEAIVVATTGRIAQRIRVPAARWHAFAPARGHLLIGAGDDGVTVIDLRLGRIVGEGRAPHAFAALAVDDEARTVAIASPTTGVPLVSVIRVDALIATEVVAAVEDEPPAPVIAAPAPPEPAEVVVEVPPLPALLPRAFGAPPASPVEVPPVDAQPFASALEQLGAMLDLVAMRAALAIAEGWHSGRISADEIGQLPFEREVLGLAGASCGLAADRVDAARVRLATAAAMVQARTLATLHAGFALPFNDVAAQLALSPIASQLVLAVLGPQMRPEIARLYRILGNETNRPACDAALLCQLFADRDAVLDELAPDAPLIQSRAIVPDGGGFAVSRALVARLRGRPIAGTAAAQRRTAIRALDELHADRDALARLIRGLADPRPARVVIRGPRGSGRHSAIAALAARIGHDIVAIDASQLPRATLADALARELADARLAQAVPVVSGLELTSASDAEVAQRVAQAIAAHGGPVVVRTGMDSRLPLDPGYLEIALPPLAERARKRAFAAALAEVGIAADCAVLARRYRVGPGTMHRIASDARLRLGRDEADAIAGTQLVDELARQHVATRIGSTAQRVTRLADWDQVALPDDMIDSLRELVGRARHSRTVYEDWGYDARIATARGLTALFYGPPGTGKTMVAGLIARELGLDVYRVDLSKVMSKWVGETEKNLGEVFDAAEDGQVMLLFDEADSLFAKRSEVKSSNDRYANLEVNYLLQRLDTFEGVAILTTNLEGSIDPAFKRRLSMRLYFPFPDEEIRARLWEAHVMPRVPTAGTLNFASLARKFPLSGGYIRNSALRAAFLAAQEQLPLTQAHLERAVMLEYRELGKLSQDGRME